ncbi:unnamed protein product, partial [Closterium sp. NIES-64]
TAKMVQDLRQQLDSLLREKIENPSLDVHAQGERVVAAVRSLLSSPHADSLPPGESGGGGGGARGGGRGGGRHGHGHGHGRGHGHGHRGRGGRH